LIQHQLHLSIKYTSDKWRNYDSASFSDENQVDITLIKSKFFAVGCGSSSCDYTEVMELNLSDDFLRSNMETGFSIGFNSRKVTNNITIPSNYIKGYLKVAK